MRLFSVPRIFYIVVFFQLPSIVRAQDFSFSCNRDTSMSGCASSPCFNLRALVPDIRSASSSYFVNPITNSARTCTPLYANPEITGTTTGLVLDDLYSGVIPIGFNFPFYGNNYSNLVVSSNGALSFDLSRAGQFAHYGLFNNGGVLQDNGVPENLPSTLYDPAQIMGVYHDIDITIGTSPNRRIDYRTVGAAPNRKWVLTYYEISLFGCPSLFQNIHQIVLNEATGIIEVLVYSKEQCTTWNGGRGMIGIQNATRDQAVMAPGRRASDPPWGSAGMNEAWRFVPAGGASLFRRAELYVAGNPTIISTLNSPTSVASDGNLELVFPNVCPPAGAVTSYVIKSVYTKFDDPNTEVAGFDTINVTRTALNDLGATAVAQSSACGATGTGSIAVSVPTGNGSGNFEYSIVGSAGPFQSSNVFQNLLPGNYVVYVRDLVGACTSTISVTVGATGNLPVTTSTTPTTCAGASNGTVTVNAGGAATTEYQINGSTWQSSNVFNGVPAGTHFINVRDLTSGCVSGTVTVTVAAGNSNVTGTANASGTSCAGGANGFITVTANGTGPFEYSLNGGAWQASNQFNGLTAGNYNVVIREGGVCTSAPIPVTVNSGGPLSIGVTSSPTSCQGINNGTITITLTPGVAAPYSIVLDGTTQVVNTLTYTFTGISAGTHTISASDATGCSSGPPIPVPVGTGTGFTASASVQPTSCAGLSDGAITIAPQAPGAAPFTVQLSPGGASQTGNGPFNFTGLAAGSYQAVVTDNNGCVANLNNISVASGGGLTLQSSMTNASCTGVNNGSITVTTNGAAPYSFVMDGTVTINSSNSTVVFQNVAAGNHSIVVTDATGCSNQQPLDVLVGVGSGIAATHNSTSVSCAGGSDGSIDISITTAGQAPYSFVLNGTVTQSGVAGTSFTGLPAGNNYTVLVTDALGCSFTISSIVVSEPAPLGFTTTVQPVSCFGAANGQIQIAATGGTAPYSYSLDNINYQSASQFALAAGNYTIYVRDANGCLVSQPNTTITEPPLLQAQIVGNSNATCEGGADGRIEVLATGGTAPYSYSSDNGATYQSGSTLQVVPGTYAIWVRDANNCTLQVGNATVGLTNNLQVTPMADPAPICEGSRVSLQPVTNGTSFNWSPTPEFSNATTRDAVVAPSTTTTYTVTIGLGQCTATDDVQVTILPAPIANAGADTEICFGQNAQLQGSGAVAYQWTPASFLSDATVANPLVQSPTQTTVYSLTVTDANNCSSLQPDQVVITVTPPIQIYITPADTVLYPGAQMQFQATSPATDYNWSPGTHLNNQFISNPVFTAPDAGSVINYLVTGTTAAGCRGEGVVTVRVYAGPELYVPNAFTPNSDGRNDTFFPFPVGLKKLDYFQVYNRAGRLIFSTNQLGVGWVGRFEGQKQPSGVYVWQVQAVTDDDRVIRKKGTVVLIR
jgi:gliding motility-associated-like protein